MGINLPHSHGYVKLIQAARYASTMVGVVLLLWWSSNTAASRRETEVRAGMKEENAAIVEAAYRAGRDSVDALFAAYQRGERKRVTIRTRVDTVLAYLDSVTHAVDTASTDADSLRRSLVATLAAYDSLSGAFRAYVRVSDSSHAESARLIAAQRASLYHADAVIREKNVALSAWRNAAQCRIIGAIPCPTRAQVAVGTVLLTLGAVVALR